MKYIRYIQVTDDLALELWPSKVCNPPLVLIHRRGRGHVAVKLEEIRPLVDALINAALLLAELESKGGRNDIAQKKRQSSRI